MSTITFNVGDLVILSPKEYPGIFPETLSMVLKIEKNEDEFEEQRILVYNILTCRYFEYEPSSDYIKYEDCENL